MKILIPDSIDLQLDLGADVTAVVYPVTATSFAGHEDAAVLVAWHNTAANLAAAARELTGLELVQTLAAGPDAVLAAGFPDRVRIASGRSLHDGPVAEHSLALVLAAVRRLDILREAQLERRWDTEFATAQADPATKGLYTLAGARVVIWGFGSIASRLAPMFAALGAEVTGIATTAGTRGGFDVVGADEAAATIGGADVVVSLVPHSAETENLFDASRFAQFKPGAVFVNVGRGRTVDEEALGAALASGQLRVAAIDVTREEPLPQASPLWTVPNLIITPHVAGNRPVGAGDLVTRNVAALRLGRTIGNLVAR